MVTRPVQRSRRPPPSGAIPPKKGKPSKEIRAKEAERVTALLPLPLSDLESPVKADIEYFRTAVAEMFNGT